MLSWKLLWKAIHQFRLNATSQSFYHLCFVYMCSWMPRLLCEGQRTMYGSQFSLSIMWVPEIELRSPVLATRNLPAELASYSFFCKEPVLREHSDLFSKSYYLRYYPNGSYIKIHIILSRVHYKKKKSRSFGGVIFFKSIKEMCQEITHFHSLNKWNGQKT